MNQQRKYEQQQQGLYRSEYEHDACGVGAVADLNNRASHSIVEAGLTILKRLMHRGATGNDPETGDGAGLLMRIPHAFFKTAIEGLPGEGEYGVGMVFESGPQAAAEEIVESVVHAEGCKVRTWRDVPTNPDAIGHDARAVMPRIRQFFVVDGDGRSGMDFERRLYIIRRQIEKAAKTTYVCSLSSRTIVYKGLLLATQIEAFYPDLSDPDFVSPFALVHQRYSTNTFPSWELAHPFRTLAHNGEINTIKGNLNALAARESALASEAFGDELRKVLPVVRGPQSDSASLDNVFELLVAAGRDAPHAMLMLMPQAWGAKYHMGHDMRAFYEYHSALMEPWDGPAAVAFTDGLGLGAALDRNGLRPARWTLTKDGLFVLASEAGVLDIPPEAVARHGRLKPGSMVWLDLARHRLMEDAEIKTYYARRRPYRRWVKENHIPVTGLFTEIVPSRVEDSLAPDRSRFGWTREDIDLILRPMAATGREPVGAMGNDAALPALSPRPRSLFDFFHQLFAQVTNPPIDPIREELVMSIMTYIGNQGNILAETPGHARLVKMTRPVLTDDELARLRRIPDFPAVTLPLSCTGGLRAALDALAATALRAARAGAKILILSDNRRMFESKSCACLSPDSTNTNTPELLNPNTPLIPALLAVAAVNKALTEAGLRPSVGLVVESGEVREVHHFAVLLGFGATAVNPYLALATVADIGRDDAVKASANYVAAVCKGLMKIMSKMGISTLRSYRSACIFEAVGLGPQLVRDYFGGIPSSVGGLELEDVEALFDCLISDCLTGSAGDQSNNQTIKQSDTPSLPSGGEYRYRRDGAEHLWTPQRVIDFREAVRHGDYARFRRFTDDIDANARVTLRSQFAFRAATPIPLAEVEGADTIIRRFVGGAMSLGSLSREAHETIARALNGLGTMSNSGEGGENQERFGTDANSAIKQVASGRFGVTIEYLRSAKDLQIKLAQGAKPGEGGQLPADKVDAFVARLRHAKSGTTLISPPPHHDIYSIEDLAQLIYDLRCANPAARISVKLVSEAGVGTIAAGVAKAHADVVVVSGFDGGTGAAPLTSMKHAGRPWEPGLAEAHQTLLRNNLRDRVKLQVDGQLCTGHDIVIAALLGADEFAFGTALLVALGCVQCRNCNLNCCPVGIATQKEDLRRKFAGRPEHLQAYFRFLAEEVREHLAALGLRSLAEARGRTDLLEAKAGARFDFGGLLLGEDRTNRIKEDSQDSPRPPVNPKSKPVHSVSPLTATYDARELIPFLKTGGETVLERTISNRDRAVGTALSGHLVGEMMNEELRMKNDEGLGTRDWGLRAEAAIFSSPPARKGRGTTWPPLVPSPQSLVPNSPHSSLTVNFTGVAGQSFGAFLAHGLTFNLRGAANDYVGKGLSGGIITIAPPTSELAPEANVIAGNVIAYGATAGAIYINGLAGERFGIRNSGATLVVEGVGDHGCEYMTGGVVAVLGPAGVNFAAGMTGGVAYVYDEAATFDLNCNLDSVDLFPVEEGSADETALRALLAEHVRRTGSPKARRLLADWTNARPLFVKVVAG